MSMHGHRPKPQGQTGPYAFGEDDPAGFSGGAALGAYRDRENGESTTDNVFLNGGIGRWIDENGITNYGFQGGGGFYHSDQKTNHDSGVDVDILTASGGVYANKNTASAGLQATGIGGALTFGSGDHMLRLGLSAGAGAGARAHYGDNDGDGLRGFGGGLDFGPISADYKSEGNAAILKYLGGLWD
jgi:hypothetical protein